MLEKQKRAKKRRKTKEKEGEQKDDSFGWKVKEKQTKNGRKNEKRWGAFWKVGGGAETYLCPPRSALGGAHLPSLARLLRL